MLWGVLKKGSLLVVGTLVVGTANIPGVAKAEDVTRSVPVGTKQQNIYHWGSVHPDCTPAGLPTVRVTGTPSHGTVSLRRATGFSNFPANNQRYRCNLKRTPVVELLYTPQTGFTGSDYLMTDSIFPDGTSRQDKFTISVR
jgi:hypothetical protein